MTSARRITPVRVATLVDAQRPALIDKILSVPVRISEVDEIRVDKRDKGLVNVLDVVVVKDRAGKEMLLLGVEGEETVRATWRAFRRAQELQLLAQLTLANERYALLYLDAEPIRRATQLLGATDSEIRRAKSFVGTVPVRDNRIIDHVLAHVIDLLGVKNIDAFPALRRALTAVILQAVGTGKIEDTPAIINVLLVGAPGTGKGIAHRAASLVNPVVVPIGTDAVTPAGLMGVSVACGNNRTRLEPGKLVLASGGVALMEDMQNLDAASRGHAFGILSAMMQRGVLHRSTYRGVDLEVSTALLGDLNPRTTLRPTTPGKTVLFLDDVGVPLSLLSRIDLIILFERDIERQLATTQQIIAAATTVGPRPEPREDPRARELRVLLAYLRDEFETVDLKGVTELANRKMNELWELNRTKLTALNLTSDFVARGGRSLLKIVAASSRLHGRHEANEVDVAIAADIFEAKMEFLSRIEPGFRHVKGWKASPTAKTQRRRRIISLFGGQTAHINKIAAALPEVHKKTIKRDLRELGARYQGDGMWAVPATVPENLAS